MKKWMTGVVLFLMVCLGITSKNHYESNREFRMAYQILESRSGHEVLFKDSIRHWFPFPNEGVKEIQGAMEQTLIIQGVKHLRRSMAWNANNKMAEKLLVEIGETAEKNGQRALAIQVLQELRSAYISTQIFPWRRSEKIERLNARLTRLTQEAGDLNHDAVSLNSPGSNKVWKLFASVFAWVWIGSIFLLIFKSGLFHEAKKRNWSYVVVSFVMMSCWVFFLAKAGP